jgi:phosphate:Na+ symporter
MTGSLAAELRLLLELAGEAALLLWGLHMVQSGVQRAFGARLRQGLGVALRDRWRAALVGLGITAALQSSTATAFMIGSFSAGGGLPLVPALAAMLGANIGTALIVQAMSFDAAALFPLLLLGGLVAFRRGQGRNRDLGRAAIGLGLMLLALHLMIASIAPLGQSPTLRQALQLIDGMPLLDLALAALLAWATHSSVAAVVLIASFAGAGAIGPAGALAMVVGANLGTALNPLLAARGGDPAQRRVPLGNLLNRLIGAAVALPLLPWLAAGLAALDSDPARQVAHAHLAFNLVLALAALPLLDPVAALLRRIAPAAPAGDDPGQPRYLAEAALATPSLAIANATREALRLADLLESMLHSAAGAFRAGEQRDAARAVDRLDESLDRLHRALQAYIGRLPPAALSREEATRLGDIQRFAVNLEQAADAVAHHLVRQAARLAKLGVALLPEDAEEVAGLLAGALDQLRLAVAVFMLEDAEAARQLVVEKERLREVEQEAAGRLVRAAEPGDVGRAADLHLDAVRDLRRVAAHLAAIGHPLLGRLGALRSSRLAS